MPTDGQTPEPPAAGDGRATMADLRAKWLGRGGQRPGGPDGPGGGGPTLLASGLGVAALLIGWLVATRILMPAPTEPDDLPGVPAVTGMNVEEATAELREAGLALGRVDSVGHSTVPAGTVFGQSPLPGQLSTEGGDVHLTVSSGAERVAVPDVKGASLEEARQILATSGFGVTVDTIDSDRPSGEVLSQQPGSGQRVTPPLEVALTVSEGPPMVTMPDLVDLTEEEAIDALDDAGLELIEVEEQFRFGQDQGRVLSQDPPAGEEVEQGSGVRIVVGRRGR